jgi:hypothetical protein
VPSMKQAACPAGLLCRRQPLKQMQSGTLVSAADSSMYTLGPRIGQGCDVVREEQACFIMLAA